MSGMIGRASTPGSLSSVGGGERLADEGSPRRVLLADHDPIVMEVFGICLRREGYQVEIAGDGHQACDLLATGEVCRIVIIDFALPGIPCLDIVQRIRSTGGERYTYIIILTRQVSRSELRRALASEADDVLILPFLFEMLMQRLDVARRIIALEDKLARRNQVLEEMNERHRQELRAATDVQVGLLPPPDLAIAGLDLAWWYRPSAELGGDLLNVVRLGPRHVGFYVLDVSGHGVASALLAVQVSRHLNPGAGGSAVVVQGHGDAVVPVAPAEVLRRLNGLFPMDRRTRLYFTILYGVVDLDRATVDLATAGHPGPVLVRADGRAEHLVTRSVPIGWLPGAAAKVQEIRLVLRPGDRLIAFSDGVTEAADGDEVQFGADRLVTLLSAVHHRPLPEVLSQVWRSLCAWTGRTESCEDDVSILALGLPADHGLP